MIAKVNTETKSLLTRQYSSTATKTAYP